MRTFRCSISPCRINHQELASILGKRSGMIQLWTSIVEVCWYSFSRSPAYRSSTDCMYACLIWNATLRRVL